MTAGMLLGLLGVAAMPSDGLVRERTDLVERNHFYNEQAEHVFDQLIFYDWCHQSGRFQVRDWRMVKNPSLWIERDWERGGWRVLWQDGEVCRLIHASAFRETWTQYDPELAERERLPVEARRKLRAPRTRSFLSQGGDHVPLVVDPTHAP